MGILQEAKDNYYITAKYLLELAKRAYDLFASSKVEEKRQLIKLVLQNLRLEGKTVQFEAIKPFDTLLNYSDHQLWLPLVDVFRNQEIEMNISFESIKILCSNFDLLPPT